MKQVKRDKNTGKLIDVRKDQSKKPGKDADTVIIRMARKGAFEHIGEEAIRATHKLGHSATILEEGGIYELHPDGSRTLLKTL